HDIGITLAAEPRTESSQGPCSESITFNSGAPGPHTFNCRVHSNMTGDLIVEYAPGPALLSRLRRAAPPRARRNIGIVLRDEVAQGRVVPEFPTRRRPLSEIGEGVGGEVNQPLSLRRRHLRRHLAFRPDQLLGRPV